MLSLVPLSFRSFSLLLPRTFSLFVLCDEIVLLEDVIGRRLLFKALLPRISVLFARIAGLPAVNIESPVREERKKKSKFSHEMRLNL